LTASFATRGSGVQIPPAPLNPLVRGISDRVRVADFAIAGGWRSTDGPQGSSCDPLIGARCFLTPPHLAGSSQYAMAWWPRQFPERRSCARNTTALDEGDRASQFAVVYAFYTTKDGRKTSADTAVPSRARAGSRCVESLARPGHSCLSRSRIQRSRHTSTRSPTYWAKTETIGRGQTGLLVDRSPD